MARFSPFLLALAVALAACDADAPEPRSVTTDNDDDDTDTGDEPVDTDGDGFTDDDELAAGSDPEDPADAPPVPAVTIDAGPAELTNAGTVTLTFTVDSVFEVVSECSVDDGEWEECASPWSTTVNGDGEHKAAVRVTDTYDREASAEWTWTLDATPPVVSWVAAPPAVTSATEFRLEWTVSEAGPVECSLDDAAFSSCESPLFVTVATEIEHSLQVRATDAAGNPSAVAETVWTIDFTPPDTVITGPRWAVTSDTSVTLAIATADGSPATFECSFDQATWWSCESETTLTDLLPKTNRLYARAIDAAGNFDDTPAVSSWRNTSPQAMFRSAHPVTSATGAMANYAFDVEPIGDGYVMLGRYNSALHLDPNDPAPTLDAPGGESAFLARFDASSGLLWVRRILGAYASSVTVSASGDILVGGSITGTLTIGEETGTPQVIATAGGTDAFLALYDSAGQLQWVNNWGGSGADTVGGVAFGAAGTVFAGGTFSIAVTFSAGEIDETILYAQGTGSQQRDAYIARFTDTGDFTWVQHVTALNGLYLMGLAAGADNEVVAGGDVVNGGDVTVRPGYSDAATLSGSVRYTWLVRLNPDGSLAWTRQLRPSINHSILGGLDMDGEGAVAASGYFYGSMTLGAGEPNQTTLVSSGQTDAYVAIYESDGSLRWAEKIGSNQTDNGLGVKFSRNGASVFATGWISPGAVFDPGGSLQTQLFPAARDAFLAGYQAADGTLEFATNFGVDVDNDRGYGIAHLTNGRLVVVGHAGAATPMKFGVGEPGEDEIVSGYYQGYVAQFGTP